MYWTAKIKRRMGLAPMPQLPGKFSGEASEDSIRSILSVNPAISGDEIIISELIRGGDVVFFCKGDRIIQEGAPDNDVYFLLAGRVDIVFKSQLGSRREAPNQVGEMAAMDPGKARSASVFASSNEVVALRVPGSVFQQLWEVNSEFQKRLDVELRSRHRERIVASEIARKDNSASWFAISAVVGTVFGMATWIFFLPENWTADAQLSMSVGLGLLAFILTLIHNPAFFWRRCFALVLVTFIGTLAMDQYVVFEAASGFGSLEVKIGADKSAMNLKAMAATSLPFLFILLLCAFMDRQSSRD